MAEGPGIVRFGRAGPLEKVGAARRPNRRPPSSRPTRAHERRIVAVLPSVLGYEGARMELRSTETAQVDAQSDEWFASYTEPSNQHRHVRDHRRRHPRRQRLPRLGTMMMILSVAFVAAMTACFYTILTR